MEQYTLKAPELLHATVVLPASKSISNRALIASALAGGGVMPENLSDCDDTEVMVKALRDMPDEIDVKAAGTAMRFMTAYLTTTGGQHVITGTERMTHRPIGELVNALRRMGAHVDYVDEEGFPPLRINGESRPEGGQIEMAGSVSSQYVSALLLIAPVLERGLELRLTGDIVSRPYIDLTLHVMHDFGARAEWTDVDTIGVPAGGYKPCAYRIENDWSAAGYWYEMMAIHDGDEDEIRLPGLLDGSRQGDSAVRYLFSMLGVKTTFEQDEDGASVVTLRKVKRSLTRLDYDFEHQPDQAQTFVVTCCLMDVPFRFTGLASLKIKETDRIEALKAEMLKLGYVVNDVDGKELSWDGTRQSPTGEPIDTYEDHRMAMAFAPACLRFAGLRINNPQVVTKSYPHFWDDLRRVDFQIESHNA